MFSSSDPPGKPDKPVVKDYDKDMAKITWKPPKNDGGNPISGYIVEKRPKFGKWEKVITFGKFTVKVFCSGFVL